MTKARTNADNASADIQGVTAGTGLSGGGTSGTVTLTNDMATTIAAKGDLVVGTGNDTYAALTAGNAGDTLVADSSATTGLRWQGNYAAGKNKIINGDFNIWQRGTSITAPIANNSYSGADRFCFSRNGTSSVITISRQAFTPGTAPVAGYEGNYFMRLNQTTAGSSMTYNEIQYKIEDVTTFAGQTVTFSFWAKADSSRTLPQVVLIQNFGSGGSSQVNTNIMPNLSVTTSWQRFSATVTLPSISGKTIGTSSFLEIDMQLFFNTTFTFDTWGWQLEAGNTATAFQTATGTLAGELAACQRYFQKSFDASVAPANNTANVNGEVFAQRQASSGSFAPCVWVPFRVSMRTAPSVTLYNVYSGTAGQWSDGSTVGANARAINIGENGMAIDNTATVINLTSAVIHYAASSEL